ncbi:MULTISPECIES: HdeD family acid-resistance protein [unclassified Shinella]|jgi:uncharacterized membrane protein HdeD (DUF308 family)|uniref:HdeD family acid-resistance protein n=1 Tax=unclassified Shinella TaxID=2643062 RepID=UPI0003C533AC|nr:MULTISPECIES: HdeD family acid-resistance protein [unclassified Shinella]MCA0343663.1 HdeD family acid-resistance protein [Pseudomonadota bacterium]EYR79183.1 hypothetical protein SHLA_40c000280 [Shinella sp. DD12]KNY17556.1 hypothetical protein AKG11_07930 [Shinella sp. SUS2]KOC75018.1 hypothetical protein AKG10_13675 [Shinella sp. GWS1]MCO5150299.1 HdeD family acid-resistance protein [Shinella sp.]
MVLSPGMNPLSDVRAKWGWFVALGVVLLVFGGIAAANLFWATVASVYYVGMLMIVGGAVHLAHAFQVKAWRETIAWALSALLYLAAGVLAFVNPVLTSAVLTLLMAAALLVAGLFRIFAALRVRPEKGWGWLLAGGIVTALAGLVFLIGWPVNSLWLLGLFLAFDLAMQGWALIAFGLALRK